MKRKSLNHDATHKKEVFQNIVQRQCDMFYQWLKYYTPIDDSVVGSDLFRLKSMEE